MRHSRLFALSVLACLTVAAACGSSSDGGSPPPPQGGDDASVAGDDASVAGDVGSVDFDSGHGGVASLAITPADAVVDVIDLGALPTQQLTATVTYQDKTTEAVSASWTVDRLDIATIAAGGGLARATGAAFGKATVTATGPSSVRATTSVTFRLKAKVNPGHLAAAEQSRLDAATTADPSIGAFAYPYDGTVFPRGLLPPEQMWNGGAAGDAYSLRYTGPAFDLVVYLAADPPSRFTLDAKLWNALATSLAGADAALELRRASNGAAYVAAKQSWHIADANLRGSIYYWAIDQGQIVKIDLPSGQRAPVFDSGPFNQLGTPTPLDAGTPRTPPWEDNGGGKRCVACHSVSKDGSTLASVFTRESSQGPFGFVDMATARPRAIADYEVNGTFEALTPDGQLAAVNTAGKYVWLVDTATGQPVPSALDGVADLCDPVFSPDGTRFAVASSCDPGFGYPVEFRRSDLTVYDFVQSSRTFSSPRTILTSAGLGDAIAFPSFSPDSRLLFFQRGDFSRAKYGNDQHGNDDLYVVAATPGATPVALSKANGAGVLPTDSLHLNYAPTVNPIAEGGYIWVVFTTPRDYGNRMVSPQGAPPHDATYANHKQLWVTAVDASVGAVDPSHPAFWLPGQDADTVNMFGYWALSPCKPTAVDGGASSCSAGFECCTGFCRDNGAGPVCVEQAGGCHELGEKCASVGDCCNGGMGVACSANVCQRTRIN